MAVETVIDFVLLVARAVVYLLFAGFIGFLGPESSNIEMTFNTLLYVMVGGVGSLSGPIAGTFIVYGLSQVLAVLQQYQMLIFGLALVLLILFMPAGLAGAVRSLIGPRLGAVRFR